MREAAATKLQEKARARSAKCAKRPLQRLPKKLLDLKLTLTSSIFLWHAANLLEPLEERYEQTERKVFRSEQTKRHGGDGSLGSGKRSGEAAGARLAGKN
jgi:hypothetical protein